MTKSYTTDRQIIAIMALLTQHLKPVADGEFAYEAPWSDSAVAAETGASLNGVMGVRKRNFGQLARQTQISPDVDTLKLLVAAHNEFVRDITAHVNSNRPEAQFDAGPYTVEIPK